MSKDRHSTGENGLRGWDPDTGPRGGRKASELSERKRHFAVLGALVALLALCAWGFWPLQDKITMGLDIKGGVSVVLSASKPDGSQPTQEEMDTARAIVESRVNALGASEASVQKQGTSSILVQIPGATDADNAVETIGRTGKLEFVRLDDITDQSALSQIQSGQDDVQLQPGAYKAFMDGSHITKTMVGNSGAGSITGDYAVELTLDSKGAKRFAKVTRELAPTRGQIAIVIDGKVNSAPAVQSEIPNGQVSITGNFTLEQANNLKTVLDSGSLPVTLTYSESRVVGPTLGQDSLRQGVLAIGVGVIGVAVYLLAFYQGLGLLTIGSLAVFGILYLGILALLSRYGAFSMTLPGLAAVVLTTGSAADSSILVLERYREEIRMGRSIRQASQTGVTHGITTSLEADAVSLVTAIALFAVAVGSVKGFGFTMILGIVCDIATMFMFKAPAIRLLSMHQVQRHPGFWGVKGELDEALKLHGTSATKSDLATARNWPEDKKHIREQRKAAKEHARQVEEEHRCREAEHAAREEERRRRREEERKRREEARKAREDENDADAVTDDAGNPAEGAEKDIDDAVAGDADDGGTHGIADGTEASATDDADDGAEEPARDDTEDDDTHGLVDTEASATDDADEGTTDAGEATDDAGDGDTDERPADDTEPGNTDGDADAGVHETVDAFDEPHDCDEDVAEGDGVKEDDAASDDEAAKGGEE